MSAYDQPAKERSVLAYALIEAPNDKEYVFGGYVRDKLSHQDFSDLDVCFTNEISFAGISVDVLKEHAATVEAQAVQEAPKKRASAN